MKSDLIKYYFFFRVVVSLLTTKEKKKRAKQIRALLSAQKKVERF